MDFPMVPHRPLEVVKEQARRFKAGRSFVSVAPEDVGPVPELYDEEIRARLAGKETKRRTLARFDRVLAGDMDVPPAVLAAAQGLVRLEAAMYPDEPLDRRNLRWFARLGSHGLEGVVPHIDRFKGQDEVSRSADALYTTASHDGTIGFSGVTLVSKEVFTFPAANNPMMREGQERQRLLTDQSQVLVDSEGEIHPTTPYNLHRFDGLHCLPLPGTTPQADDTLPPRLLHVFRVEPIRTPGKQRVL